MTVAAFLRDAKARGALGGTADQANAAIAAFFNKYDYADCAPLQLLALADLAMRGQNDAVARSALDGIVTSGTLVHLARYRQGRLDLAARDFAAAAAKFEAGTAADPAFPYNWMGLARALHALGQEAPALAAAQHFASFGVRPHAREDIMLLGELADGRFAARDFAAASKLLELFLTIGAERPRDAIRLAEAQLELGDTEAALAGLRAQAEKRSLDAAGRRLLMMAEARAGIVPKAAAAPPAESAAKPRISVDRTALLDGFKDSTDQAAIRAAMADHADLLGELGVAELQVRLLRAGDDLPAAVNFLCAQEFAPQTRLYYLAMETGYACVHADRLDLIEQIAERLTKVAPNEVGVKVLRIDGYFRAKLWERAAPVFAAMSEAELSRPHVVLKFFEFSYFTGDAENAARQFAVLEKMQRPNRQFMLPMLRYLAEMQNWDALIDHACRWIGGDFLYAQVGYVLFRGARYTGRHADLIAAIMTIQNWTAIPDLCRLRAILLLDRAETLEALDALAADPAALGNANFTAQVQTRRLVLAKAANGAPRQAVFLCADHAFLCGMIVTLHNMTTHADRDTTDFYVVTDDSDVAFVRRVTTRFTADGISLTVIAASDIVDDGARLDAVYGIFNSGQVLSAAAYYRIYFARYLQRLGRHHRAFYVDGDVLARGDIDAAFELDMGGHALAARLEKKRPEVLRAAALHNLPDGRFFNSGILLFDLKHQALAEALDRAIDAATNPDIKLIYHDQCALNRAFAGQFQELDPIWNFAMTETTPAEEMPHNAVVLHFLDRPKPWSAAHNGVASAIWYAQWQQTAAYLGEALALELFATLKD